TNIFGDLFLVFHTPLLAQDCANVVRILLALVHDCTMGALRNPLPHARKDRGQVPDATCSDTIGGNSPGKDSLLPRVWWELS
ncbi:MAG TPA: hypothetical protein P5560_14470, partial [Thermotogota bacterium]|nr:hypothetical protein [Thermotogota bacterium]HRW94155.1 hypothetical protein [Thermotogota bacterium]